MLKYKFVKSKPHDNTYYIISVSKPYELLSDCVDTNCTSQYVQELIEGLTKVSTAEYEEYSWQSQLGILVYVCGHDASNTEDPDGGCYVYNLFDDTTKDPKFKVSIADMLQMLTEYKQFLVDNKR